MNKRYVLKKSKDIEELVKTRCSVGSKYYAIYYKKEETKEFKIAVSVSKKVGTSPVRNYEKRIVREIMRLNQLENIQGYQLLIVIKKLATDLDYQGKEKEINELIKRIRKGANKTNELFNKKV